MGGIPSMSSEIMDDLRDVIQKGMIVVDVYKRQVRCHGFPPAYFYVLTH